MRGGDMKTTLNLLSNLVKRAERTMWLSRNLHHVIGMSIQRFKVRVMDTRETSKQRCVLITGQMKLKTKRDFRSSLS